MAWQWANAKINKKKSYNVQTNYKHYEGGYGRLHWAMFTHAMDFFQEWASLKNMIPKLFFTSLLKDLLTEDLVTLGNLLST